MVVMFAATRLLPDVDDRSLLGAKAVVRFHWFAT